MTGFTLTLPLCPPLNNMYVTVGKRRILSAKAAAWRHEAGILARQQLRGAYRIAGPFDVAISVPADMRGDIDGRIKLPVDMLVSIRAVPDDTHMQRVSVRRCADIQPGTMKLFAEDATP